MGYALITGASEGIGKELARCAAKDGFDVILAARSKDKLQAVGKELEDEFGVQSLVLVSDLSKPNAAAKLWAEASQGREIDVLVNNAGLGANGLFAETDSQREADMINVNVVALTDLMKHAVQHMQAHRGRAMIMNVASVAGFISGPKMAVYHATKAYVLSLSEAVASELAGSHIVVSVLCPGATQTEFFVGADMKDTRMLKAGIMAHPRDVAIAGWHAMNAGQTIQVPGFMNKVFAVLPRVLPRKLGLFIMKQFYARKQ